MAPDQVAAVTREAYEHVAPLLGCHSPCREAALIALGCAAARGVQAALHYDPSYTEDGTTTPHFTVVFADGAVLDCWDRTVRLRR